MVTGIALPPICIARTYLDTGSSSEHCSQKLSTVTKILTHIFHFSSMITNIVIVLVRLLMVYFTVMVGVMWREVTPIPNDSANRVGMNGSVNSQATGNTSNEVSQAQASDQGQTADGSQGQASAYLSVFQCCTQCWKRSGSLATRLGQKTDGSQAQANDPVQTSNGSQAQARDPAPQNSQLVSDTFVEVCKKHTEYLIEYEIIVEKTRKIYKIFQSFFVLQWIIHLFQLFVHIAHLLRPWIRYGQVQNANMLIITQQIDQLSYAVFNGLALVIAHVCGLKMNAYMRRYLREVQYHRSESLKDKLKAAKGKYANEDCLEYSLINLVPIKEECISKSAFTPRIPGTGLGISITNPGFIISIVLSVFALIGAMIAF